ncbi:hypothetical protein, partial [Paucilactobacillus nenjiangensis]|uniref:hypothetical protein n=1 Tax=Paucilactobacillus nenjiangensis TaxID=1296540 RepID=UPI001CDBD56E
NSPSGNKKEQSITSLKERVSLLRSKNSSVQLDNKWMTKTKRNLHSYYLIELTSRCGHARIELSRIAVKQLVEIILDI